MGCMLALEQYLKGDRIQLLIQTIRYTRLKSIEEYNGLVVIPSFKIWTCMWWLINNTWIDF